MRQTPNRIGKTTILRPARDDMPVDVWGNVAQAGEVDLVRIDETTQNRFDGEYNPHHLLLFLTRQIAHFTFVAIEDDSAVSRVVCFFDQNDTTQRTLPDRFATGCGAEFASIVGFAQDAMLQETDFARCEGFATMPD